MRSAADLRSPVVGSGIWTFPLGLLAQRKPAEEVVTYMGGFDDIADAKEGHMHAGMQSFDGVKPLCRKIRGILFHLLEDESLNIGTPAGPRRSSTTPSSKRSMKVSPKNSHRSGRDQAEPSPDEIMSFVDFVILG